MYIVAHPDSFATCATEAEAVSRAKGFTNYSGKPLVLYQLVELRRIEPPLDFGPPMPRRGA